MSGWNGGSALVTGPFYPIFAFKKDTNDTRESAAIAVCEDLLREHAHLAIYDPGASPEQIRADLGPLSEAGDGQVEVCATAYEAAAGAHAVAVLTEWDEFGELDYERIYETMLKPALVFDGRNVLDLERLRETGFRAVGIGKGN